MQNTSNCPSFAEIAQLIVPNNTPSWLPAHLEWWAQGLRHDRLADGYRPTRAETRRRLEAISAAATLLQLEMTSHWTFAQIISRGKTRHEQGCASTEAYRCIECRRFPLDHQRSP